MTFDNSKAKLYFISKGFIKIFKDVDNGNFSKIKEITVPEFHSLNNIGPFEVDSFDAYGCNNKTLYLEVKIILIVKEENSLSFFNISENYKLINIYKENNIDSYILSIDRYDEDKIIAICNFKSLKVISINENKILKYVEEINKEKYFEFRIIKTYREKNIIILEVIAFIKRPELLFKF